MKDQFFLKVKRNILLNALLPRKVCKRGLTESHAKINTTKIQKKKTRKLKSGGQTRNKVKPPKMVIKIET